MSLAQPMSKPLSNVTVASTIVTVGYTSTVGVPTPSFRRCDT